MKQMNQSHDTHIRAQEGYRVEVKTKIKVSPTLNYISTRATEYKKSEHTDNYLYSDSDQIGTVFFTDQEVMREYLSDLIVEASKALVEMNSQALLSSAIASVG